MLEIQRKRRRRYVVGTCDTGAPTCVQWWNQRLCGYYRTLCSMYLQLDYLLGRIKLFFENPKKRMCIGNDGIECSFVMFGAIFFLICSGEGWFRFTRFYCYWIHIFAGGM